jgi:serine/threonine protein kinase
MIVDQREPQLLGDQVRQGQGAGAALADTKGFLPEAKVVRLAIQACDGLRHLRSDEPRCIALRDVKPSNIIFDEYEHIDILGLLAAISMRFLPGRAPAKE